MILVGMKRDAAADFSVALRGKGEAHNSNETHALFSSNYETDGENRSSAPVNI